MANYACPRCKALVTRSSTGAVSRHFGLVGALVGMAFAGFACPKCGDLKRSDFPPAVRSQMMRGSMMLGVGAVLVFGALIAFLIAVN